MRLLNARKLLAVSILTVLSLSYQNCARTNFAIDDELKEAKLAQTPALGDHDPGDDTKVPDDRDPGDDTGGGGTNPRDPGDDTGGTDPRDPGTDNPIPGMPTVPGTNPRDPGTDQGTTPRDPGNDTGKKNYINVEYACPMGVTNHGFAKAFKDVTGEVKMVLMKMGLGTMSVQCEVKDIKQQILKDKRFDVTSCGKLSSTAFYEIYLVESNVTSDYKKNKLNAQELFMMGSAVTVAYTEMDDKANNAKCDIIGDPLLVQISKSAEADPIRLTSAENGVLFDLLGKKNDYEKVRTAWFADNKSENYFLVLPDEKGDVKGIDQLFGDNTVGPDKRFAKQGFAALAKHDGNRDKIIDSQDEVFSSLRLWKDENLDGIAQKDELFSLDSKEVAAIDLRYDRKYKEKDIHGNMVKYKSVAVMKNGSYALVFDLWLRYIAK